MEHTEYAKRKDLIAREVSSLLKEHDCVIVPGFGGLVSGYSPAKVHPVSHVFQPPHKQILFNRSLKTDDGMLVHRIMPHTGLTYAETRNWILEFADMCLNRIQAGERTELLHVGYFLTDPERNIQFRQDYSANHLPDAYGLYPLQASLIARQPIAERRQPLVHVQRGLQEEVLPAPRKNRFRKLVRTAPVAAVVLAAAWLFIPGTGAESVTGLNFFPSSDAPAQALRARTLLAMPAARQSVVPEIEVASFSAESARIFVVAGCYSTQTNADGMVNYLTEKGFNAFVLDQTPAGLFRVVYGSYADIASATDELQSIRKGLNEEAWLLIR